MCYTLKSIFVNTPQGPTLIKGGLDDYLLPCQANPPSQFHLHHPAHFLTPQSHKFILSRIAFGPVPPELGSIKLSANKLLLEHSVPLIQELDDCSFIFFPRWIEQGKSLCRQLGQNEEEIVLRVDTKLQPLGPIPLEMLAIARNGSGLKQSTPLSDGDVGPLDFGLEGENEMHYSAPVMQIIDPSRYDVGIEQDYFSTHDLEINDDDRVVDVYPNYPVGASPKRSPTSKVNLSSYKLDNNFWSSKDQHKQTVKDRRVRKIDNRVRRKA